MSHVNGCMKTGEIALWPSPKRASRMPAKDDVLLTMSDLLEVKLSPRLILLSCCHSRVKEGCGWHYSSLFTRWCPFCSCASFGGSWQSNSLYDTFLPKLLEERRVSESLHQAKKCLRESHNYSDVKYWATLICSYWWRRGKRVWKKLVRVSTC